MTSHLLRSPQLIAHRVGVFTSIDNKRISVDDIVTTDLEYVNKVQHYGKQINRSFDLAFHAVKFPQSLDQRLTTFFQYPAWPISTSTYRCCIKYCCATRKAASWSIPANPISPTLDSNRVIWIFTQVSTRTRIYLSVERSVF